MKWTLEFKQTVLYHIDRRSNVALINIYYPLLPRSFCLYLWPRKMLLLLLPSGWAEKVVVVCGIVDEML